MAQRTTATLAAPRGLRTVSLVLLVTFIAIIAVITFWPGPPDPDGQRALRTFLRQAHLNGWPLWITFGKVEFGANIMMFAPIGFFGALALPRARWVIVPAAMLASGCIEAVQVFRLPERVGTARDVLANGIGAFIGYVLAVAVLLALARLDRRRSAAAVPALRRA